MKKNHCPVVLDLDRTSTFPQKVKLPAGNTQEIKIKLKFHEFQRFFQTPHGIKIMIHISFRTFSSLLTILQSLKEKRKQNTERMGSWKKFRKHIFQLQSTSSKQIPIRKVENLHPNKNRKKCFFFSSFVRLALNNFLRFFVIG